MQIIERKLYRFTFELAKISQEGIRMNPYRFDVEAESDEDAKVKLLQDLQQVVEQIANTLPNGGATAKVEEGKEKKT